MNNRTIDTTIQADEAQGTANGEVTSEAGRNPFIWEDPPDPNKISPCVHCGMCLESCPTYQQTGLEAHSPRGRVYLIKSVAEGKVELNDFFRDPIDTCLDCRACETACPANVQVGALVEETRGQFFHADPPKGLAAFLHNMFLHRLFPHPNRMRLLGRLLNLYEKSGLQTVARKLNLLAIMPKHLAEMERALPSNRQKPVLTNEPQVFPAIGKKRATVALLTGCVMDVMYGDVNAATIRVLQKNGCEVRIPHDQSCCGALHVHAGDRNKAKQLARQNVDAFLSDEIDAVIINAAGCGSNVKEYDELLKNDPSYADKAKQFADKVKDVSEFLYQLGLIPPKGSLDMTITYHDACHLAHAQGIRSEPRELLDAIPGLNIVDLPSADRCCGSAGIYNLTHPEMAGQLLDRKMDDIPAGCDAVAMGNPGCMMQFSVGVVRHGRSEEIVHTVSLLDRAYQAENTSTGEEGQR